MKGSSRMKGFYKLSLTERLKRVQGKASLACGEVEALRGEGGLNIEQAERMIENAIGIFGLPLGLAVNFRVNGRDYLIPMAIEEPSVVAGASHAAKLVRAGGGFTAGSTEPLMIGQLQVVGLRDPLAARLRILAAREQILELADSQHPTIVSLGGGSRDLEVRVFPETKAGPMLVLHLIYDTRDAMGANAINSTLEAIAPLVGEISGGRVQLPIVSNLADRRLVWARGVVPVESLAREGFTGEEVAQGILDACVLAELDPYRAATHNKGIMNGIDAVALATGNDWRALEAGAHAFAVRSGCYSPLTTWGRGAHGNLTGTLEMPMAVGIVGGAIKAHPTAQVALKILGVKSARELGEVMGAVGLAQNLAALRALAAEGIQEGHMALHARQVAMAAGAEGGLIDLVAARLVEEDQIRLSRAEEILEELVKTS